MITFKKKENKKLTENFNSKEFECSCGKCDIQKISQDLVDKLQQVREKYGKSITVTSGYRCEHHNKAIGGKPNSSHLGGLAADIAPTLMNIDELDDLYEICFNIFDNIGDGRSKKFIHVDIRPPKSTGKRHWIY